MARIREPKPSVEERFWSKVDKNGHLPKSCPHLGCCWIWTAGKDTKGYGHMSVDAVLTTCHRLSWQIEHGEKAGALHVLHHCDNPAYVRPTHLFLGTNDDNVRDKLAKDRQPRGIRSYRAKLTEQQVLAIRERVASGEERKLLAVEFGVERHTISRIAAGLRWGHLGGAKTWRARAKLTLGQVSEIRRRAPLEDHAALAAEFGISRSHLDNIAAGRKWTGA